VAPEAEIASSVAFGSLLAMTSTNGVNYAPIDSF